jgi:hypothetical protein
MARFAGVFGLYCADVGVGPIFILGSQGSGSTLLRLILDSHEHIAIPQETGFMRLVAAHRWVPFWEFGDQWWGRLDLTSEDLDRRLAAFYGGMFDDYAGARGKPRWGDKTPFHIWHVEDIERLFPEAVFLGIVRHPFGAVASMRRRFDRSPSRAVRHWSTVNRELAHQGVRLGGRFGLIRYEDLVGRPEEVLRATLAFVGEPWSERVLRHHEVQREQGAPRIVDGRTRSTDPLDPARIGGWRDWLDGPQRDKVARRSAAVAAFYGYDVAGDDPVALAQATPPVPDLLVTGDHLAGRSAALGGVESLLRPRPPWRDRRLKSARAARRQPRRRVTEASREAGRQVLERMPAAVVKKARGVTRRGGKR